MKKKVWRKGLFLGMSLALSLGLCSCGKKEKSMENAALAKEHVYRVQEVSMDSLSMDENGWTNVLQMSHMDGRIYLLTCVSSYDAESGEEKQVYSLSSMKEDGSDVQITELQMPKKEEAANDVNQPLTEEVVAPTDEGDVPVEMPVESWEYTNYFNFLLNDSGEVYGIKRHQKETYGEEYISEGKYYVCHWDADGKLLWEKELEGVVTNQDEWVNIDTVVQKPDGTLNLLVRGNEMYKISVDAEGNVSEKQKLSDELNTLLMNYEKIITKKDGTLFIIYHDENDWQKVYGTDYNLDTDTMTEAVSLPESFLRNWDYNNIGLRLNGDLYFTTSSGIFTYKFGDEEPKMLMDYTNSDMINVSFNTVIELSDQSFAAVYSGHDAMKAGIFHYVKPEDIADKAVIVLAGNYLDYNVKERILDFNRTNQEYRIVTKEYNIYNTYEDWQAGITKLNNDIIAGNMPDILMSYSYEPLPIETYISKGWIADINKLIQKDEELSQEEFLQNVFDAHSIDGKLYYVVPEFQLNTMIAKSALVGDRTNWSLEDMKQVLAGMGEDARAFGDTTRESFMYMALQYCGDQFVDLKTGTCNFNSKDFISMMEFAKTLPEVINYDDDYWIDYDWSKQEAQYRENRTLMMATYIYNFQDLMMSINGYFGEPVSFVGFPTEEGNGAYIQANTTFSLAARSDNLDGAWQFVRYYLTDEYQKEKVVYMPVNKEAFYEKSKTAMERPYWENEEGEKEYYDYTIYINGEEIVVDPLNQEQVNQVVDYIQSISNRYYYNEAIVNIVNEEIGAFYSDQKSAQDVADVIQRRAQIYVDENS